MNVRDEESKQSCRRAALSGSYRLSAICGKVGNGLKKEEGLLAPPPLLSTDHEFYGKVTFKEEMESPKCLFDQSSMSKSFGLGTVAFVESGDALGFF